MNILENICKVLFIMHQRVVTSSYKKIPYYKYVKKYNFNKCYKLKEFITGNEELYFTARPNPGAGIGHQMANWIAGFGFSRRFNLKYAYMPFSDSYRSFTPNYWDSFLGFGKNEIQVKDLVKKGYKLILLPLFDEYNDEEIEVINKIISNYFGQRVIFICEQDQFYYNQFDIMDELKLKFYNAKCRKDEMLVFNKNNYNIAIHVRRGDIVQKDGENNENLSMRWLDNDYFIKALENSLEVIKTDKPVHIYIFSQGKPENYKEFNVFNNVHFCLDMSAKESFLHMCYSDALITSKSSFSYKPALLNNGLKICPAEFWHGYPNSSDWILLDNSGRIIKRKYENGL